MRFVNIDDCDRELFYKQCGGKDSLITVEAAFNMLEALPIYDINKVVEQLEELMGTGRFIDEAIEIVKAGGKE